VAGPAGRSLGEIRVASSLIIGLVDHWRLDEPSGVRHADWNGLALSEVGAVGNAPGKINMAAKATLTEWLSRPTSPLLNIGNDSFTVVFWCKRNSLSDGIILSKYINVESANRMFMVQDTVPQQAFRLYLANATGTARSLLFSQVVPQDTSTWFFVAVGFDKPNQQAWIRVDTTKNVGASLSPTVFNSAAPLIVGRTGNIASQVLPWDGLVDELGIWSRKLTDAELDQLYNGGAGLALFPEVSMTIYVVNLVMQLVRNMGTKFLLDALVELLCEAAPTQLDPLKLRLFQSDTTPDPTTEWADLTEADFTGYVAQDLPAVACAGEMEGPALNLDGNWQIVIDQKIFAATGAATTNLVYGFAITDADDNLLWIRRFEDGPYLIDETGDAIKITATLPLLPQGF